MTYIVLMSNTFYFESRVQAIKLFVYVLHLFVKMRKDKKNTQNI